MNPTNLGHSSLRLLLPEHHEEIAAACAALRTSAYIDDPLEVIMRYRNVEHAVLEHMRAEEDFILPAYARRAPADAAAIRATHEDLRRQLYRLGIDAELHCIRLESIDQLTATLRDHAAREDREMYPWAQRVLAPATKRELFKRMTHSLRALALYNAPKTPRPAKRAREVAE
jgi:hypothetical protein